MAAEFPATDSISEYWANGQTMQMQTTPRSAAANKQPSEVKGMPTKVSANSVPVSQRNRSNNTTTTWKVAKDSILAGSLAGMISTSICYPFDVLRTKVQQAAASSAPKTPYQVLLSTLRSNQGARALYAGFAVPFAAQAIFKSTVFLTNNITTKWIKEFKWLEKRKFGDFSPVHLTLFDRFVCGALGGAVNGAVFVTPVEYVRNQTISKHTSSRSSSGDNRLSPSSSGPVHIIRSTFAREGIVGLWRGWGVTVARDSVGCGFFFVAMHSTSSTLGQAFPSLPPLTLSMASGALAGLGYWAAALPMDTLKTWVQTHQVSNARVAFLALLQRQSIASTFTTLTRGWQVAFGRGGPSAAITIGTYDYCYRILTNSKSLR